MYICIHLYIIKIYTSSQDDIHICYRVFLNKYPHVSTSVFSCWHAAWLRCPTNQPPGDTLGQHTSLPPARMSPCAVPVTVLPWVSLPGHLCLHLQASRLVKWQPLLVCAPAGLTLPASTHPLPMGGVWSLEKVRHRPRRGGQRREFRRERSKLSIVRCMCSWRFAERNCGLHYI